MMNIRCGLMGKKGIRRLIKTKCTPKCPYWNACTEEGSLKRINIECVINFIRYIFRKI
jgi:hypothetical protein